jgi:hypothetical protein
VWAPHGAARKPLVPKLADPRFFIRAQGGEIGVAFEGFPGEKLSMQEIIARAKVGLPG